MVRILKYLAESSVTGYTISAALILSFGYGLNQLFPNNNSVKAEKPQIRLIERARDIASEIDFYPPSSFSRSKEIATELLARNSLDEVCRGAVLSLELQKLSAISRAGNVLQFDLVTGQYNWTRTLDMTYQIADAEENLADIKNRELQLNVVCEK